MVSESERLYPVLPGDGKGNVDQFDIEYSSADPVSGGSELHQAQSGSQAQPGDRDASLPTLQNGNPGMSDDRIKKSLDRVTMPDQPVAKVVVTKKGDDWLYQAFMGDEHKFDIASGIALDVEYLFKKLS